MASWKGRSDLPCLRRPMRECHGDWDLAEWGEYLFECSRAIVLGIAPCLCCFWRDRKRARGNWGNQHQSRPEPESRAREEARLGKALRGGWVRKLHIPNVPSVAVMPQCFRGSKGLEFERVS
jgi:hypothetical protein